jgi:hypothetical protein
LRACRACRSCRPLRPTYSRRPDERVFRVRVTRARIDRRVVEIEGFRVAEWVANWVIRIHPDAPFPEWVEGNYGVKSTLTKAFGWMTPKAARISARMATMFWMKKLP